jgi:hypothetical protein
MPNKLVDLCIREVSSVDRPANKRTWLVVKAAQPEEVSKAMKVVAEGGKFCLYNGDKKMGTFDTKPEAQAAMTSAKKRDVLDMLRKAAADVPADFNENYMLSCMDEMTDDLMDMVWALRSTIYNVVSSGAADKAGAVDASVTQFSQALATMIQDWISGNNTEKREGHMLTKMQIAKIADEEVRKAVEAQQSELTTALETAKTAQASEAALKLEVEKLSKAPGEDDIWKGVSDAVRKRIEESDRRAAAAEAAVEVEKSARLDADYIAKAAIFKALPSMGKPEEFGPVLREIAEKMSKESAERLMTVLKSSEAMVKASRLLKVVGGNESPTSDGDSIGKRIDSAAREIAKRDNKEINGAGDLVAMYDQVFRENPELYDEYRASNAGRVGNTVASE